MAHSCPECSEVCFCGGDIDDCEFEILPTDGCAHCLEDEWGEMEGEFEGLPVRRLREDIEA